MIHAQDYFSRGQAVRTCYGDVRTVSKAWEHIVILNDGEVLRATNVSPVAKIRGRWRPIPIEPIRA